MHRSHWPHRASSPMLSQGTTHVHIDVLLGRGPTPAATAGAKPLPCSFSFLRERQVQTAARGMLL